MSFGSGRNNDIKTRLRICEKKTRKRRREWVVTSTELRLWTDQRKPRATEVVRPNSDQCAHMSRTRPL